MFLTEIAELIKDKLEDSPPETWVAATGYLIVPDDVTVKVALDPFSESGIYSPGIFVIPGYVQFGPKDRKLTPSKVKFITVAVCIRMKDADTQGPDITSWVEGRRLVDLKECLDNFLVNLDLSEHKLSISGEIETDPPDEIVLDNRYFLATTVIGYDAC